MKGFINYFFGFVVGGGALGLILWGIQSNLLSVSEVDIQVKSDNLELSNQSTIKSQIDEKLSGYRGRPLYRLNLQRLSEELLKDHRVARVKVARKFPSRLEVVVTPQTPIAAIWIGKGSWVPVMPDNSILPERGQDQFTNLPLMSGKVFLQDTLLRQKAIEVIKSLPESGLMSRSVLSEVNFDKKTGFSLLLNLESQKVLIGHDLEDLPKKYKKVEQVIGYLKNQQLRGRVIDARLSKKVVVKMRNGS